MTPEDIQDIRQRSPQSRRFDYYRDREAPWLLAQLMPEEASVSELRKGPAGRLLDRPLVREAVAASGGKMLRQDIRAVADPTLFQPVTRAGDAGVVAATKLPWLDYEITLEAWGDEDPRDWARNQLSRPGGNLVLQVNFPKVQDRIFETYLPAHRRADFEFSEHPVREEGRPTMAWVRLDIDRQNGEALIEEVQSDWFRYVTVQREQLVDEDPQSRRLRDLSLYEAQIQRGFGKNWARVALFAAVKFLREDCNIRTIFYHQHIAGRRLKHITAGQPPISLYTDLPRRFAFQPTRLAPAFLLEPRVKTLGQLRARPEPLFWKLVFEEPA